MDTTDKDTARTTILSELRNLQQLLSDAETPETAPAGPPDEESQRSDADETHPDTAVHSNPFLSGFLQRRARRLRSEVERLLIRPFGAATPLANDSVSNEDLHTIIDEVMEEYLPRIEAEVRQRLRR